jgi:trk system potassium uptake protein
MFFIEKGNKAGGHRLRPVQVLALGFAGISIIGSIVLMMPISSAKGQVTPFIDSLFTAISAVCITGFAIYDTGTYWSLFGQIFILLLIQIGGLGFMTFSTFLAVLLGKKISLKERLIMQEAFNAFNIQGVVKLMLYVFGITFTIEGIGAILLATQFIPVYGWEKGIYFGIFHSISSFCNAGFDLLGNFSSLVPFSHNAVVILTVSTLVVSGGLGFIVIAELINRRNLKRLTLHTKVVVVTTLVLMIIGAFLFFMLEHSNPKTMGSQGMGGKILSSIFASIVPRSGGFSSISIPDMTTASKFLTIILMFIGASPGSTGGGIKVTTTALIFMTVISVIKGREDTEMFERRINKALIYRALAITTISLIIIILVTMILAITQKGEFIQFLYEATSAFGTVGLTLGLTPNLDTVGKIVISLTMYAGKVGPLTLALAFAHKQQTSGCGIKYPEDKILVG